jgi:hypothetical protein
VTGKGKHIGPRIVLAKHFHALPSRGNASDIELHQSFFASRHFGKSRSKTPIIVSQVALSFGNGNLSILRHSNRRQAWPKV